MTCSLTLAVPPRSGPDSIQAPLVSPHLRVKIALKASQPFVKNLLIDQEFLILHDVRNLDYRRVFFLV